MKYEEKLLAILKEASVLTIGEAEEFLRSNLEKLHETGELSLGNDKDLSGKPLELRVKELFKKAGFNIKNGRNGYEDFTISPDNNFSIQDSIVIEVKSSKNISPKLSDLRQLDDWVFNLSGEENARKHGLGSSEQFTWSGGMTKHPTPHKGLFIFNGPIGHDFNERLNKFIHPSQLDFLNKRNFCAISLNKLVYLLSGDKESAWNAIHETIGEFN
ncbi:hypothetical protein [Pseudoalteromonas sp. SG43-3]|uniref:hypothetical protein n=1 Tax=Pseudoalteromonas sp. SG43-3 TaxID=2760970 RepID=UPI001600F99E|nr:hypothetical protein [Pseudoalteromonas sp. SG43-3]MBB1445090.1 hypothetical protein [Pseudoalteromonas sp. SG43-3]|tara:strand:- start:110 stop:754 length:645 start_codon:yes stop_codon:yes gene_type:complete